MVKTKQNLHSETIRNLAGEFNLGLKEQSKTAVEDQPEKRENIDFCLPPLLVEAFQSGLEEDLNDCSCGCGEEHDCTHHAPSSGHHDCGGCHHHD